MAQRLTVSADAGWVAVYRRPGEGDVYERVVAIMEDAGEIYPVVWTGTGPADGRERPGVFKYIAHVDDLSQQVDPAKPESA